MSTMKSLLMLLTLCAATPSFADFSGKWTGSAVDTTKDGSQIACDEVTLNVQHFPDRFEFGTFRYVCGNLAFNFTPPKMRIVNGEVFWKDLRAGVVTPTSVDLVFPLANKSYSRYTVRLEPSGEMDYLDEEIDIDPATGKELVMSIRARLVKVPKVAPALAGAVSASGNFDQAGR
jgi:hypothetical protein